MNKSIVTNVKEFIKIDLFAFEMSKETRPAELVEQEDFYWPDTGHDKPRAKLFRFCSHVSTRKKDVHPIGFGYIHI